MELLQLPNPGEFVFCRMPLSDDRTNSPAKVWHTALVLGMNQDFDGTVKVTVAGTTSKVTGKRTRVVVRAGTPEGRAAGAKNDFEICCEWRAEVPLTPAYFGDKLSVKGNMSARLRPLLAQAVQNLAKLER